MSNVTLRADNGGPLTMAQMDANFSNLDTNKVETSDIGTAAAAIVQTSTSDAVGGRVMVTGAFGLGGRALVLNYNTDNLNSFTTANGTWAQNTNGTGNSAALNYPSTNPGILTVRIDSFASFAEQWYAETSTGTPPLKTYHRTYTTSSTWTSWTQIWDSGNLDPASFATAAQGAKADSALQIESDPTVPAWAKTPSKPGYTKAEVGLGNVDNTSDVNKPVSTAQQAVLDSKAALSGGAAANFAAMPQVGGSPIVESGSNANGAWIKWADGTMICSASYSVLYSSWTLAGTSSYSYQNLVSNLPFPSAFIAIPTIVPFNEDQQVGARAAVVVECTASASAVTSWWVISMNNTPVTTSSGNARYVAIGRWK